jgi:hypothetical protein
MRYVSLLTMLFVLPGTADDLALLDGEPQFSLTLPAGGQLHVATSQIPEPAAWSLLALSLPLIVRGRRGA